MKDLSPGKELLNFSLVSSKEDLEREKMRSPKSKYDLYQLKWCA
jgi:hypothetical protein